MFRKEKSIGINSSASHLCKNLSLLVKPDKRQISYAVIHKYTVNIVTASTDGTNVSERQLLCKEPSSAGSTFLMQVKWLQTSHRCLLFLATQKDIQVFDAEDLSMIYWHGLSDTSDSSSRHFARGIACIGNYAFVGTEMGKILMFNIPPKGTNITLHESLDGHRSPICDLCANDTFLVSGDGHGSIVIWNVTNNEAKSTTYIEGYGSPCNSLCLWKGAVISGYASGHIRVFSAASGRIGAESTAHCRAINALDVSKEKGLVLSVSDDSFFRVWQIKPGPLPQLSSVCCENVTDMQLVGGQFVDTPGKAICLTAYDCDEIMFQVHH